MFPFAKRWNDALSRRLIGITESPMERVKEFAENEMGKALLGVVAVSLAFLIALFVYAAFTL
jgi:hypothetical protein